jgi:hypothetical protein
LGYETNISRIGAQRKFHIKHAIIFFKGEKDDDCVVFVAKKIDHIAEGEHEINQPLGRVIRGVQRSISGRMTWNFWMQ